MPTLVFVYGTLMRGDCRHGALAGQEFAGEARTIAAYRMYDVGTYPALVEAADGVEIEGEVWRVSAACRARLDAVEGVDEGLYARRTIRLQPPFDTSPVEAYFYLQSTSGMRDCGSRWHGRSRGSTWNGGPPE
jgi:gamma-glutamylaminecyclotransferase